MNPTRRVQEPNNSASLSGIREEGPTCRATRAPRNLSLYTQNSKPKRQKLPNPPSGSVGFPSFSSFLEQEIPRRADIPLEEQKAEGTGKKPVGFCELLEASSASKKVSTHESTMLKKVLPLLALFAASANAALPAIRSNKAMPHIDSHKSAPVS